MQILNKIMSKVGYVPESYLISRTEERNKAQENLSLCEKMSKLLNGGATLNKDRLKVWAKTVKEEANFTCDICKETDETKLTAHHLYDKSTHPSLAYIPENGVCLCMNCHNAFHNRYTSKSHTTPRMYNKFKTTQLNSRTMWG